MSTSVTASVDAFTPTDVDVHSRRGWLNDLLFGKAPLPKDDSFYKPPADFASKPLGSYLKHRSISPSTQGFIPSWFFLKAYQVLYRTQDLNGKPIAATTTIIYNTVWPKKDALLSFQVAYDSSNTKCQPSYTYNIQGEPTVLSKADGLVLYAYLFLGYTISVPDNEGPDAAFAAGRLAGMVSLDGIRAALQFRDRGYLKVNPNPVLLGIGYSGGAIATGWMAGLQPTYAPELNMKGWVIGGVVPDLIAIIKHVAGTWANGFLPGAINGLGKASAYGVSFKSYIDSIITPTGRGALQWADERCTVDNIINFAYDTILDTEFSSLGPGIIESPQVLEIAQDNLMGGKKNETPTAPILMYHGGADEIAPFDPASTLYDKWCENGANIQFSVYESGGHLGTPVLALLETIDYTAKALSSKVSRGCSRTSKFDVGIDVYNFDLFLQPIAWSARALIDLFGVGDEAIKKDPKILNKAW